MPEFPKLPPVSHEPISIVLLAVDPYMDHEAVAADWLAFVDGRGGDDEVILVDEWALAASMTHPRLRVAVFDKPLGVGAALRTGLAEARRPLIFYTLLDPRYRPEILASFLARVMPDTGEPEIDHMHLLSGYRAGVRVPAALRAFGWVWRMGLRVVFSIPTNPMPGWLGWRRHLGGLAARIFLGVYYKDTTCPARLLRRDILPRIPIQSDGPMAHVELVAKANFLGSILGEEVPLSIAPGPYCGDGGAIFREAMRVWVHPDFGPAVLPATAPLDVVPPS